MKNVLVILMLFRQLAKREKIFAYLAGLGWTSRRLWAERIIFRSWLAVGRCGDETRRRGAHVISVVTDDRGRTGRGGMKIEETELVPFAVFLSLCLFVLRPY